MELPIHRAHDEPYPNGVVLRVDGLVAEPRTLTLAALQQLPQWDFTNDFICLEGWTVPGVKWGGVLLEVVLCLRNRLPRFVVFKRVEESSVFLCLQILLAGF